MNTLKRAIAATELVLIFPAALFMTALFVRNLQPQQFEPAHTAQRIVEWYAARTHLGLWLFLMALPLAVLIMGAVSLATAWRRDPQLRVSCIQIWSTIRAQCAALLIALATLTAGGILAI